MLKATLTTANSIPALLAIAALITAAAAELPALYESSFSTTRYGRIPDGWRDLNGVRPSRNWAVDGNGRLRQVIKGRTGLGVYDGYTAVPKPASALTDARIVAPFTKTEDDTVSFGIADRVQDRDNYCLARFSGIQRLSGWNC